MSEKMQELLAKRETFLTIVNSLMAENKMDSEEATAVLAEAAKNELAITNLEKAEALQKGFEPQQPVVNKEGNGFKIVANALKTGKFVNSLGDPLYTGGLNGESYLLPEDVKLAINIKKKEWLSAKDIVTVESTFALSGSVNYGTDPSVGLVSFSDGDEVDSSVLPSFSQKTFTIGWYGAIVPVSQILTGAEQAGLMQFIDIWFVRRAIITENTAIFGAFKAGYNSGTPKSIANEAALRKSINTDLDPAYVKSGNMVIVTNQDGFNYLDSLKDEGGAYVLQPSVTDPTQKTYKGYPLKVFSNTQLPNRSTTVESTTTYYIPFIYGDTKDGVTFKEYENYFFDTDNGKGVGFTKNQVLLKVIEGFAVISTNSDAYIYGEITKA